LTIGRIFLNLLKIAFLTVIAFMAWMQVPELRYDLGSGRPLEVEDPAGLKRVTGTTFAVVRGNPDFTNAFVYRRYGLDHSYFTVMPYGMKLVVRTYDGITDEWRSIHSFVGRLRPFDRQPFSRYIAAIYRDRFGVEVPSDAYFLALDDVPEVSGWQVGSLILVGILWFFLFWFFFLKGKKLRVQPVPPR
jgi:hypothetical protein